MADEKNALRDETDFDHYFNATRRLQAEVQRLTVERDRARAIAVALEQQTARVLDLSRGWDELARNVKNPHLAYNEGWADAKFGCADDIQRLLGDETENQQ